MPQNDSFSFQVLVGGLLVREYQKDGEIFIVTDLMHETTYYEVVDVINGETERQQVPVTPYKIAITLTARAYERAWAIIHIDGVVVSTVLVRNGEKRGVKGFEDEEGTREFLFSLPRFGSDKDTIGKKRLNEVGVIEVVLEQAIFVRTTVRSGEEKRAKLDYAQATKKDAKEVTRGKHTMATTKPGRLLDSTNTRKRKWSQWQESINIFDYGAEIARLRCKYHMKHTLADMGIDVEFQENKHAVVTA